VAEALRTPQPVGCDDVPLVHPEAALSPSPLSPILVIEDDRVSAAVIKQHLVTLGLANPVRIAGDGDAAVSWLSQSPAEPNTNVPALILLDRELPGRSGLDVLRWLQSEPTLRRVPVVILTGSSDVDGISEAYALGVRSYLVKPIGFGALGEVVRGLDLRWAILPPEQEDEL